MNLIEEMQKATGLSSVEKVDPNTQEPKDEQQGYKDLLPQAVIPVSLLGLYHYTRNEDNAQALVGGNNSTNTNWKNKLYGDHSDEVASQIASYAHTGIDTVESALNQAVNTAIGIVNNSLGSKTSASAIADIFKDNRSVILKHLPAALQIGSVVNDNTLDDRTNKMEGPMSGLMHTIEKIFSDSDANNSSKQ